MNNGKKQSAVSALVIKAKSSSSHDKAVRYLEQAIQIDSISAVARITLAERYESVNLEWKAESVLLSGYSAGIREPALMYHLGRIALELNKFSEAASYLEQIPRSDSLYLPAVFLAARSNILKNDFHTAAKWLDTLSRYDAWKNKQEVLSLKRLLNEKGFFTALSASSPVEKIVHSETVTRYDLAVLARIYLDVSQDSASTVLFEDISVADTIYPVCAAVVQKNFLEALPDGKFHPGHQVKKRNLAFYLFNWLKFRRFDIGAPVRPVKTWKDLASGDPHFTILATMEKSGIIAAAGDTLFGADQPVSGKDAVAAFERVRQLLASVK